MKLLLCFVCVVCASYCTLSMVYILHLLHDTLGVSGVKYAICHGKSAVDATKVSETVCARTCCMGICGCSALTCCRV